MPRFNKPTAQLQNQNTFSLTEVGVTHPNNPSHIRLLDNGDIHIIADDGLGLLFNRQNKSVTILGDTIRFLTTNTEGLAWNNSNFNENATSYSQPALNPANTAGSNINMYQNANQFYNSAQSSPTTNSVEMAPGQQAIQNNNLPISNNTPPAPSGNGV